MSGRRPSPRPLSTPKRRREGGYATRTAVAARSARTSQPPRACRPYKARLDPSPQLQSTCIAYPHDHHVCAHRHRHIARAVLSLFCRRQLKQHQVPQALHPQWSFLPFALPARLLMLLCLPESLVPDGAYPPSGTFEEDLDKLVDILEYNVPAYVLVRLDDPPSQWLAVHYVPDSAKVRDKVRTRDHTLLPRKRYEQS